MGRIARLVALGLLGSLPLGACSSGGSGGGGNGAGTKYSSMRSATCLQWQGAMCDFMTDKCQFLSRADCDEIHTSFFCKDDASLTACMQTLTTEACPSAVDLPQNCKQLNDPLPLLEYCKDYGAAVCAAMVRCEGGQQGLCEVEVHFQLEPICGTQGSGIGLAPSADQCLADLNALQCPLVDTPESCKGVVKILPSPSAQVPRLAALTFAQRSVDELTSRAYPLPSMQTR